MRILTGAAALVLACNMAFAAQSPVEAPARADAPVPNICFGGLEDGKLIPHDGQVRNQFRETTVLGCSVDGGEPVVMPDLIPVVVGGKLA